MTIDDINMFIPKIYEDFFFKHDKGRKKIEKQINFIDCRREERNIGKKVLDLGCGTGKHLREMARRGYEGTGIDLREDMLEHARMEAHNMPLEFLKANMTTYNPSKKYDIITSLFTAINYLPEKPDIKKAIENAYLNLGNKGMIVIESREATRQPQETKIKKLDNGIIEIGRWEQNKERNDKTTYHVVLAKEGLSGFLHYDQHEFTGMETQFLYKTMMETGFQNIRLFEDFKLEKETRKETDFWKTTIVGYKGGR